MDYDLDVISEDENTSDPLFNCILSAMNSMKEATADKIYQKLQKEGATNYSKPQLALQVDRALENALKYGIFEVKNNRYRVRDNVLDDVDTVYWKMQKLREQTPFHVQDDRQLRQNLDPEKDNLRFKKPPAPGISECPQCGRIKKSKRKSNSIKSDKQHKMRKLEAKETVTSCNVHPKYFRDDSFSKPKGDYMPGGGKYDTTDESELDSLSFLSDDEQSFASYNSPKPKNKIKKYKFSRFDSEGDEITLRQKEDIVKGKKTFVRSLPRSETSILSNEPCDNVEEKDYYDFTNKSTNPKPEDEVSNCYNSTKLYDRDKTDEFERKSDWIGYTDIQQGAIIQSNNVLTIEPMDSMALKGPEHTSYIS
ncbi:hypothetical protein Phum_PHUM488850 [Pediculus humanus corporis]|uniref:Uncharacterized protein n=1 Tax=Pediculus humanus subsp. corporis TaxID=121224 RepID=E0VWL9_PEDHC|nr:uncharacterized protein Phum_PHUM488850 [Pediculus humanus corporis]EEB17775.1 hypothetical protein Phum_PHUM488850 [Pediculus humanus corporis]